MPPLSKNGQNRNDVFEKEIVPPGKWVAPYPFLLKQRWEIYEKNQPVLKDIRQTPNNLEWAKCNFQINFSKVFSRSSLL